MATVLPPLATGVNSFPSSPILAPSYNDLVTINSDIPYGEDLSSKRNYMHAEYNTKQYAASLPSTAPSSPIYTHSTGSRASYFSTPSYSSLDPNEDFSYDDDDAQFPSFGNNQSVPEKQHSLSRIDHLDNTSSDSTVTASPPPEKRAKFEDEQEAKDDHWVVREPTRHVDYLSHEWAEHDIWSSWRYVNVRERRKKFEPKEALANGERLENAAWRTWTKSKYHLKTISPESLNWMKDCDVTWLYGPLQIDEKADFADDRSPPASHLSTCSSFLHKKPILKKKSASAVLLERSLTEHNLLSRVGEIIKIQRSSPIPRRPNLRRGGSEFSLPSYHTSSVVNTPADCSRWESSQRPSFDVETPSESKHVLFNLEVRQVQAIDSEDDEKENAIEEIDESDEDDDGGLMMAPARSRSNRSTPRSSFSSNGGKTIAPLPPTTLKYRKDTPEPPEVPPTQSLWPSARGLQHSSSQETLKPSNLSHNFLLDDDPELNDDPWPSKTQSQNYYLPYTNDNQQEPEGMRRTASGMFMPYDENEDEAAMNSTLFGQAMYAVNTFRDIAHVVWNVGWSRGK